MTEQQKIEKVEEIVHVGIKMLIVNELSPYSIKGASNEIATAIVRAMKEWEYETYKNGWEDCRNTEHKPISKDCIEVKE